MARDAREPADLKDDVCERSVLGSLLLHPDLFGSINGDFAPDVFGHHAHRLIAQAMRDLHRAGTPPEMLAVKGTLQDNGQLAEVGIPYLLALPDDVLLTDADALHRALTRLHGLATARRGLYALDEAKRLLVRHPEQAAAILASHRDRLAIPTSDTPADDQTALGEPLAAFLARSHDQARVPWLIDHLLPSSGMAMFHGQPRDKKTLAAFECALALTTGTPAFGLPTLAVPRPLCVWYVSDEDPPVEVDLRFRALLAGRDLSDAPGGLLVSIGQGISLDDPDGQARVIGFAQTHHVELTILDPVRALTACADAGPDKLEPFAAFLRVYQRTTGSGVLLIHHDVKPLVGKPDDRAHPQHASGGGLYSKVTAPIHVEGVDEQSSLLTPAGFKFSLCPAPVLIRVESDDPVSPTWMRLVAEVSAAHSAVELALQQAVLDYVRAHPDLSTNKVAEGLHKDKRPVGKALDALVGLGQLDSRPGPRKASLWFVREGQ